jgi:NAD-dependent DNA ligase
MSEIAKKLNNTDDIITTIDNLDIKDLEDIITYAADKYYNTMKSVISDSIYDMLIDFLKLKAPKSKVLKNIGAKIKSKDKVSLDYHLGSMDKIKPPSNQLEKWANQYTPPYILTDKVDGISALLVYKKNNTIKMYTRGTSTEGLDISHLIKYLNNIADIDTVKEYCKKYKLVPTHKDNIIALRGELIIKEKVFNDNWAKEFKNARNTVAGLVNSKSINPQLASDTDLVLYEVVDPYYSMSRQLEIIKDLKFNCVYSKTINKELTFELLSEYFKKRRTNSEYMNDGIIVTNDDEHKRNTNGNPSYAFAFKDILEDQKAKTKVKSIEWNISKDGYLIPTILLEPVIISGVEIKRVTGHNAKYVIDNRLGNGAEIELIRSGDVIPYINKVLKAGKIQLPEGKWSWSSTKVDIILDSLDNTDILKKNLYFFFSTLDTKGLGEKVIDKLYQAKFDTVSKILDLTKEKLEKAGIESFKEKTIDNILKAIKKAVSGVTLAKIMAGSNKLGHGLGFERMKQILSNYPKIIDEYKKWSNEEFIKNIKEIDGWDTKTATLFVNNFDDFIDFYNSIKKYITIKKATKITTTKITNMTFVFSSFRDKELQETIELMGGKVSTSVSKNTDYLVVKDDLVLENKTEKIKKAEDLGVKIITRINLVKLLN